MKEINYLVTKNDITPKKVQAAGLMGEHLSTRIIFTLSSELLSYEYLLNITTGAGEFYSTDFLILSEDKIYYDLPNTITASGGICNINLIIKNGEEVMFSFPARLSFESTAEGSHNAVKYISEIANALKTCTDASNKTVDYSEFAKQYASDALKSKSACEILFEDTKTYALNTENSMQEAKEFVENLGDIDSALDSILALQNHFIGGENLWVFLKN